MTHRHAVALVVLAPLLFVSPSAASVQDASCSSLGEFVSVNNAMNALDSKMLLARTRFQQNPAKSRSAWITAESNSVQTYDRLYVRASRLVRRADVRSDSALRPGASILKEQLSLRLEGGAIMIRVLAKPSAAASLNARFQAISARVNVLLGRWRQLQARVNAAVAKC